MSSAYDFNGSASHFDAELRTLGKSLQQPGLPKDSLVKLLKVRHSVSTTCTEGRTQLGWPELLNCSDVPPNAVVLLAFLLRLMRLECLVAIWGHTRAGAAVRAKPAGSHGYMPGARAETNTSSPG